MSISETAELYRQRFELLINNAKWNYRVFYSIYRSRGVRTSWNHMVRKGQKFIILVMDSVLPL